jgi:hypothetical protein
VRSGQERRPARIGNSHAEPESAKLSTQCARHGLFVTTHEP